MNFLLLCCQQLVVPIILTSFALLGTRSYIFSKNEPVEIHPWLYVKSGKADALYSFVSNDFLQADWPSRYVDEGAQRRSGVAVQGGHKGCGF